MATLNEIWDGLADGSMERPTQVAILQVLVTRARSTANSPDMEERMKALRVGRIIGGPEAVDIYRQYASDSELSVRETVFEYSTDAGALGLPAIRALVKDADLGLNHRVFGHLFKAKDPQGATAVRGLLNDEEPLRRAWAALITGALAGPSMVLRVQPLADDENDDVKAAANWALAKMNGDDHGKAPLPGKKTASKSSKTAKTKGKAKSKKEQLPVPVSKKEASDSAPPPKYDFETITAYFKALGEAQDPDELVKHIRVYDDNALSAGLRDAFTSGVDPATKRGGALAAARTGNTRWAGNLRRMINDANPGVRAAVAESLGALCTNAVSIQLATLLRDEHDSVRAAAAKGLATGAPKINSVDWALQLLRGTSEEEGSAVHQAIQDAIASLGG